jgi:hypothetical protein
MARTECRASGVEYLQLATTLLRSARRMSATGGVWEAADLQWWWRRDQHRDPRAQTFWLDAGSPIGAVILTNWGNRWQCDLLSADLDSSDGLAQLWPRALEQLNALSASPVELVVRADDRGLIKATEESGFEADEAKGVTAWMDAAARPQVPALALDDTLVDRSEVPERPHHLIPRNGDAVTAPG